MPDTTRALGRLGTPLECCPTSNVKTGVVAGWEKHPIRALHDAGVAITVNTDDPGLFGTTLTAEWEALGARLSLRPEEILAVGVRTARSTFLPPAEQGRLAEAMTRAGRDAGVLTWFAFCTCHNDGAALDVYGPCRARHPAVREVVRVDERVPQASR